ncbi:MAG: hypothetical protein RL442_35 [Pseudomonadota bacterium]
MKDIEQIKAHARAIKTKQREELEDAGQLLAAPGYQVVVIRKPWPVGRRGIVIGLIGTSFSPRAVIDFDGTFAALPLDAIARHAGAIDCAKAQIRHNVALIKFRGGEFLE